MPVLERDAVLTDSEIEAIVGGEGCDLCTTVTDLAVAKVAFVVSLVP